jgi:hypothetical protein
VIGPVFVRPTSIGAVTAFEFRLYTKLTELKFKLMLGLGRTVISYSTEDKFGGVALS